MNSTLKSLLFWMVLVVVGVLIWNFSATFQTRDKSITFSEFVKLLDEGQIQKVTLTGNEILGTQKSGDKFRTYAPPQYEGLGNKLVERSVEVTAKEPSASPWAAFLYGWAPILLMIAFWIVIMRQMQSGGQKALSFGKSRAKLSSSTQKKVTFKDVAGVDEAKEELQEIIEFLKEPQKFQKLGGRIPKGVLLMGSPGTGKTLLARAVAGEANVPFFSISGSDFVEMFVGVGASRVRDLFEQAKKNSPCIIFIDEIDAVGRQRGAGLGGGNDEREQTLNQILVEMDGFDSTTNVIIIAATNRPDVLDPALLRPGRFDRQVVLDRPDIHGRKAILEVHSRGKPLESDVDLEALARQTPGFSGADLENLVNEAAILAARRNKKTIGNRELTEAIDRVVAGPERKSRVISEREKLMTAYHEAGHALVARMLPNADPVHKVSIVARGMMGGYTRILPEEDRFFWTKKQFEDQLAVFMGGHVAEELVFQEISTGASNDIERATNLARRMVTEYGMSKTLGPLAFCHKEELIFLGREINEQRNYSDEVAFEIDKEIRQLIDDAYQRAKDVLTQHQDKLEAIAMLLVQNESIEGYELEALFDEPRPQPQLHGPSKLTGEASTDGQGEREKSTPRPEPGPKPSIRPQPAS